MNQGRAQPTHPLADVFLRMNYDLAPSAQYSTDTAVKALMRLPEFSQRYPYSYVHIDKPNEGETHAIYLLPGVTRLPSDGIRYLEEETRHTLHSGQVELEVLESKSGYIPGSDTNAWRVRRIFRLSKGGHPSMAMLHYSRGPPIPIPPHLINQPVRTYPLREVNEPSVYVIGEHAGQRIHQNPHQQQQIASVTSHSGSLARMELARREREKETSRESLVNEYAGLASDMYYLTFGDPTGHGVRLGSYWGSRSREQQPPPQYSTEDDDDSYTTNRSLALMRFTRNHDNLAEIFSPVAISQIPAVPSPYAGISVSELEKQLAKLNEDVELLRAQKIATAAKLAAARPQPVTVEAVGSNMDIS